MKPYYQDNWVTIYHGDCRAILPNLPSVDLVLTDPPYNCGKDYGACKDDLSEDEYESMMALICSQCRELGKNQAWVAPRYKMRMWTNLFPKAHLVVVRRGASGPYRQGWSDQFETILCEGKPKKAESDLWDNIRLKGEGYFFREETFDHPGYTPYPIMLKLASLLAESSLIDPFCGTGTSLRAGKDLGIKSIGIELEEKYWEISAKRMAQEVFAL